MLIFLLQMFIIKEMRNAVRKGRVEEQFFWLDPTAYIAKTSRNFNYIDNLFLKFFAVLTNRDIIILPLHPESASVNREFTWIFGNFVLILCVLL